MSPNLKTENVRPSFCAISKLLGQPLIACGPMSGLGCHGLVPHSWVAGPSTVPPHTLEQVFGLIEWCELNMDAY